MESTDRRYDIDWVRVIAFYFLIFFHSSMFFVPYDFHFKNNKTSEIFSPFITFFHQWRLPLLFIISGMGVRFAMKRRSPLQFIGERSRRLLIPLIFGMFVVVPPQIYFERIWKGAEYSYSEFYKLVLQFQSYPAGNFSWHHLWFIVYLFVFCILCLPLFMFFMSGRGKIIINRLTDYMTPKGRIFLFAIPLTVVYYLFAFDWPETHDLINDWYNFFYSMTFFILGFIICSNDKFWEIIDKNTSLSIKTALFLSALLMFTAWFPVVDLFPDYTFADYIYGIIKSVNILAIHFAIFGIARKHLNKPGRFLTYANESVYPFYILHQSVMMSAGFYILQWDISLWSKFALVIIATVGGTVLIYEVLIRWNNPGRLLFGLKPKAQKNDYRVTSVAGETSGD